MMKTAVFTFLAILTTSPAFAALSSPLATALASKGVSCQSAPGGDICTLPRIRSREPKLSYSEPVAILIPPGVDHPSDLILHLHGFRGVCESQQISPARMANNFGMLASMKEAGAKNSVMIFPMSQGQEDTFNAELVPQFHSFVAYMTKLIEPQVNSHWTITGHSGAFRPIGSILARADEHFVKRIDSVILLDATYTQGAYWYNSFARAARINRTMDVYSVYRQGGGTEAGSHGVKAHLPDNHVEVMRSQTQNHCQVVNKYVAPLLEKSMARHQSRGHVTSENASEQQSQSIE